MAPAGIDGGDEAVHKSSSQVTLCWRKQDSNPWSPVRGDNLRRNLALVEELKALAAALAARQISAGYAAKGGWGR
jgi:hypothetical protein